MQLRTTTGQRVAISYDPHSNTLIFHETDWFAEPLRATGVPAKSEIRRALGASVVPMRHHRGRIVRRAG